MRAKWLWTTWAHLALAGVIALEVLWLTFAVIFLVPKFQVLVRHGTIDPAIIEEQGVTWVVSFLERLSYVGGHYTTWLLLLTIVVSGIFEWRVRSENKSLIRLSVWGTAAIALMVFGILTAASLVIPYQLAAPAIGRIARPFAIQQLANIDTSVAALEKALANKNWDSMQAQASQASQALDRLVAAAPAIHSLILQNKSTSRSMEELRAQLKTANGFLLEAQQAAQEKDAGRVDASLRKFRELYGPAAKAATVP